MTPSIPVIAIDGPTASGKGTVAAAVAARLGFHYLDSGALYRIVALAALRTMGVAEATGPRGTDPRRAGTMSGGTSGAVFNNHFPDPASLAALASAIDPAFVEGKILDSGEDITLAIRAEAVSQTASRCAVFPAVRQALLQRQREFRRAPGLVADGRDMGTVVFPDAPLKVYLTASAEERTRRRYKQLIAKGIPATLDGLLRDLRERDARDSGRADAPLVVASDALVIDTTGLSIVAATDRIVEAWETGLGEGTESIA